MLPKDSQTNLNPAPCHRSGWGAGAGFPQAQKNKVPFAPGLVSVPFLHFSLARR